jgi:hypothetical protein
MRDSTGRGSWRSTGVVAWTDRDGPGRPPAGPSPALTTALGAGLVAVFSVILVTDTLCPEHRLWVQALATVALVGTVVAAVGLFRGWATAPFMSVLVTMCGMAIGVLDSVHAAQRGLWITAAFGVLWVGSIALLYRSIRLVAWDRSVRRSLATPPHAPTDGPHAGDGDTATADADAEVDVPPARHEVTAPTRTSV